MRGILRLSGRRLGLVLLYHRVDAESGDPRRELVPPIAGDLFAAHLRHLKRHYAVVPVADLSSRAAARRRGQRFPVAITFDDDLPTHLAVAAQRLTDAGVRATFFLSGASLERARSFWWERLQRVFDAGGAAALPPPAGEMDIHGVSAAVRQLDTEGSRAFGQALEDLAGPDPADAGIRASDVSALAALGHEIGFHTLEHLPLSELDAATLQAALRDGRDELESAAGKPVKAIAYPFGSTSPAVAAAARAAGFERGYTTRAEPVGPNTDPLLVGRLDTFVMTVDRLAFTVARVLATGRT